MCVQGRLGGLRVPPHLLLPLETTKDPGEDEVEMEDRRRCQGLKQEGSRLVRRPTISENYGSGHGWFWILWTEKRGGYDCRIF